METTGTTTVPPSTSTVQVEKRDGCGVFCLTSVDGAKPLPEADRLIMMESLLGLIAGENLRKMSQIEIISQKGLRSRILTFLAIQRSFFGCDEFTVPYNREELADYLCVNRSALSHELRRMEQEHLLYCRKNIFRILDAELYSP